MKRYIKTCIVFLSITALSACKDVSLDPVFFRPTTFSSEPQLTAQLAGIYNILEQDQLYGQGMWGYLNAGTDESFRSGATASTVLTQHYNISSAETNINLFWRNLYKGIEFCNVLLEGVDKPVMDENKRTNIKGQALFMRAYFFYLLASNFGDVPLKIIPTTEMGTDFYLARTSVKEIYEVVLRDMTAAEKMVQTIQQTQTTTIVTQTAVQAILARVCLTMAGEPLNDQGKYQEALNWATKVISSNTHSLNGAPLPLYPNTPAYARLFINNMQNNMNDKNLTEGIWDAAFLSKSNTSGTYMGSAFLVTQQLGAMMGIYCPDGGVSSVIGFSPGTFRVLPRLFNLYAPGDQRRDWIASTYSYKNTTTTKYPYLMVNITGGGGTGATATAYTTPSGAISSIVIDNPGSGYTSAPVIGFTSYTNSSVPLPATPPQAVTLPANIATATASVADGKVTTITVTKPGLGYPTVYERTVGKWRREYEIGLPPIRQQNYTSCNFPIVRYADVLLMAAEADLKVNGSPASQSVEYYNQVRRRAYGYDPKIPVPGFDVATFTLQDIMDERSRELCFEGQRRNDLIRWGTFTQVMQDVLNYNSSNAPASYLTATNLSAVNFLTYPDKYKVFPIPMTEINLNPLLIQNKGW